MSTFTHAKALVLRVVPWPEEGGYVNIHYTVPAPHGVYWNSTATINAKDFEKQMARVMKTALDVYFCTSIQSECHEKQMNGQYGPWIAREGIRSQANVVSLKALFVDLDVKPGAYPDTKAAMAALAKASDEIGLPRPQVVVLSGTGGAHCYWVMCDALSRREWQPLANALAMALRDKGVMFDAACTIDSARILRLPDTFNHKTTPASPTKLIKNQEGDYSVEAIRNALASYVPVDEFAHFPKRPPIEALDEMLVIGEQKERDPIVLQELQCPFVVEAFATGGAAYDNFQWMQTSLLAAHAVNGREAAHLMAKGHAGYSVAGTDDMFDRKLKDVDKGMGWATCDTIEGSGYAGCKGCAFKGKTPVGTRVAPPVQPQAQTLVATPATPVAPTTVYSNDLPDGYQRNADGHIEMQFENDQGVQWRKITTFKIEDVWAQKDPWVMHFTTLLDGKPQQCHVSWEATATADGVPKALTHVGLTVRTSLQKDVRELFVSWMDKLRNTKDAIVTSAPFGWIALQNGKTEGFSYAGRVWTPGTPRTAAMSDAALNKRYSPHGELQPWIDAAKMTTDQKRPDLDCMLAAAFAGPIVSFTGREGTMLSCYSSESGIGKTSTLKVSQAVWGSPKAMQGTDDTKNFVTNKMGTLKNLPMYWDELKSESQVKGFADFIFNMTKGTEKGRMTRAVETREQGDWQTLLVLASNDSLLDVVTKNGTSTTDAGLMRVMEFPVTPPKSGVLMANAHASRILQELSTNYGNAGLIYAQFLGANFQRVDTEVVDAYAAIEAEVGAKQEERYWTAVMCTLVKGAEYSNELGLTEIDVPAMRAFLINAFYGMRKERGSRSVDIKKTENVGAVLSSFLRDMRHRHTLITNKIKSGAGKPAKGEIMIRNDASKLDGIIVQVGESPSAMRIDSHAFSEWLQKKGYSRHVVVSSMEQKFGVRKVNGKLGGGTDIATGTLHCLELDLTQADLAALLGD